MLQFPTVDAAKQQAHRDLLLQQQAQGRRVSPWVRAALTGSDRPLQGSLPPKSFR